MQEPCASSESLTQMFRGGVIMDVTDAGQATIAQEAGACAVMALERVPADIRRDGGVARMSDPKMIKAIKKAVNIPVMAKVRIGHFVEAQILQALEIDYIDESEVLTPADEKYHIDKTKFKVPFVCGARNLGEALRRIAEGAAMIRTKGEAGTGNIVEAVDVYKRQALSSQALLDYGVKDVYVCCTHGVLSGPAIARLKDAPIKEVVITNTIPLPPEKKIDKTKVLSVAPIFGEAIIRIYEDLSVSELFE